MRVEFAEAISDPLLLKKRWEELSLPQQVVLKALYGLPLKGKELDHWAMLQGSATFDELGYPTSITPIEYEPKRYGEFWGIVGRRAGKTDLLAGTILAYECCLGGHEDYIRPGQACVAFLIAHKLDIAQANMRFVRAALDSSPLLSKQVVADINTGITLKNGIIIAPAPASMKGQRGLAVPVVGMDEVGFWYTDSESANPDFEVQRSLRYNMAQFPDSLMFGISTPWAKIGLLWQYYEAGTDGKLLLEGEDKSGFQDVLVVRAPTAAMENPRITRKFLEKERARDPDAFKRESLALFSDSVSGFLSYSLLKEAVSAGIAEREPLPRPDHPNDPTPHYIAAIDPGFRRDSFAFVVCHQEGDGAVVVDLVRRWTPQYGEKLNPEEIFSEISPILRQYRVELVFSDQYQLESLQQLALAKGFSIEGVDLTSRSKARIFGSLQQLLNRKRLHILDPSLGEAQKTQFQELAMLEKKTTQNGFIQIAAPPGQHDDMAAVLAIAAYKAIWLDPTVVPEEEKEPTLFEQGLATIKKRTKAEEWD